MSNIAMQGGATGTGTVSLVAPSTSTNRTINLPDSNGTVLTTATAGVPVNGPAFSAYLNSAQTITLNTATKITFNAEEFDTNNCFDPTTNYRFTPTVAGYYQVTVALEPSVSQAYQYAYIYKNGALTKRNSNGSSVGTGTTCTALIYMNGSTDYLEGYTLLPTTSGLAANSQATYFSAAMIRSAT